MKRLFAILGVIGLLAFSAPAQGETVATPPNSDAEPPPTWKCANFSQISGSYFWTGTGGTLDIRVDLAAPACSEVDYDLFVVLDWGPTGDLTKPAFALDNGPDQKSALLFEDTTGGDGAILEYKVPIEDDDPTICVISTSSITVTTSDHNGNGNTVDDQHKGNAPDNNKDKNKFASSTYTDRAPNTDCEPFNLIFDPLSGGRDYN